MKQLEITKATDSQLRDFASLALQIDTAGADTRAKLLAAIGPAWDKDFILVADDTPTDQVERAVAQSEFVIEREEFGPTTFFKVLPTDMPGGKDPAHPDVNGFKVVIQRNVLVGVPYAIYEALKNANIGAPYEVPGEPGRPPVIRFTEVTNYPLSEVTLPRQADLDAWKAKWGQRELGDTRPPELIAAEKAKLAA